MRQPARTAQFEDHRVKRIRDANDEGVRTVRLDPRPHVPHHAGVDPEEIVPAHAGFPGDTRRHDHHVCAPEQRVRTAPADGAIAPGNRRRLGKVERLAGGHPFLDIEQRNITKVAQVGEVRERPADLSAAHQRNLR